MAPRRRTLVEDPGVVTGHYMTRPDLDGPQRPHHGDQICVSEPLQVLDGAAVRLRLGSLGHAPDQLLGQLRGLEMCPGKLQCGPELLQHVTHPATSTGEMEDEVGAHSGPAKPGPIDDCLVELFGGGDPIVDQMEYFPPHRLLEPIGQVTLDLLLDHEGVHAQILIEVGRSFHGRPIGLAPWHHLDEGKEVHRVEGMAHQEPLGVPERSLHLGRKQPGGAGGNDHLAPGETIELGVNRLLDVQVLWNVLLDEVGGLGHIGRRAQPGHPARIGAGKHSQLSGRRPGSVDAITEALFGTVGGIGRHHVEAPGKGADSPSCPDDSGANQADDRGHKGKSGTSNSTPHSSRAHSPTVAWIEPCLLSKVAWRASGSGAVCQTPGCMLSPYPPSE